MVKKIYTVGHSTKTIQDFIDLLIHYKIQTVVDVRTIPKSRHNPQFNKENLKNSLAQSDIQYTHLPILGGLKHTTKASVNAGWHNLSFRGFADYMQTQSFWQGIKELEVLSKNSLCALMCAEAVPWRCHRSLIADALTLHKWKVIHIYSKKTAKAHVLTPFLRVEQKLLVYPDLENGEKKKEV